MVSLGDRDREDESWQEEKQCCADDVRVYVDCLIVDVEPRREAVCNGGCGASVARVDVLAAVLLPFLWGALVI